MGKRDGAAKSNLAFQNISAYPAEPTPARGILINGDLC
jgi:hypothetical protein